MFSKLKTVVKPICGGLVDKTCGAILGILNGAFLSMALFIVAAAVLSQKHIHEYDNLYLLVSSFDNASYPKWLQGSNSFYFMDNALKTLLKIPYVDHLLQQINFDMIFSHDVEDKKIDSMDDSLDLQLNNLLENE
jgi:hypothetical protein